MGVLVAVDRGGDDAGAGGFLECSALSVILQGRGVSGICLRKICGSFQDLGNLDVGVGEGGSIGESGESVFLFSELWIACIPQFGGGRFHGILLER